jgi:hypothetical protein
MRSRPLTLLGPLLVAISGCFITPGGTGDPIACTELYTEGGLAITVNAPPTTTPGRYRLQVRAAGDTLFLDYDLAQDATAECVAPCADEGELFVMSQGIQLPSGAMFGFVTDSSRSKGPVTATVQVLRGSTEIYQQQVAPTYRTTEPNGRGCGEVSNADLTVTLP